MPIIEGDRPFRIRPRAPKRTDDNSRVWPAALRRVLQLVQTTSKSVSRFRRGQDFSIGRAGASSFTQRCAVRVTYSLNRNKGQWAAHGRYVARESAVGQKTAEANGFDAKSDHVDVAQTAANWQSAGDPRMFKMIVSPEFGERLDLKELTRRLINRMQADLRLELEWVAVSHFNTEHPHVHVLLRGVAGGREIRLSPVYVKAGIRKHAEDLCTAQLGYRSEADRAEARIREVDQPRFTSLDYALRLQNIPANEDTAHPDHFIADVTGADSLLPKRLFFLRSMGLAEPLGGSRWRIRKDFETVLQSMKKAADRQKMLANCAALISDQRLPMALTPVSEITALEARVIGHVLDDATGRAHMILEGTDAKIHFIAHNAAIESARQKRLLQPNNFVRLFRDSEKGGRLLIDDFGNAEDYLTTKRLAYQAQRLAQKGVLPFGNDWGGWLGRYESALRSPGSALSKGSPGRAQISPKTSGRA